MRPSKEYTIKILSTEDFDLLPYSGAKDSFGLSDTRTKTAYIRQTGVKDMDIGTIHHEFDELMQGTSLHEIDGIRYKSGGGLGKILGPVIGTIVGVITGLPPLGAAVGAAISGGTQAHSQSVKPEKYGSGFGGIASSAAMGGLGGYGGASLINAGRVAATNAAIASGATGNTLSTFGAGLKGALGAASSGAGSAALSGAKSMMAPAATMSSTTLPGYENTAAKSTYMEPSTPSIAFAPQLETALSEADFKSSLANLDKNAALQKQSVFDRFRGQTTNENSAFQRSLNYATTSSEEARRQFLEDQKKLGSTYV